jgi:surface protein
MSLNNARHVVLGSLVTTPPTPVLPEKTIRCKFSSGYTPTMGDTQTLVDAQDNVWDIYKASNDWSSLFGSITDLLEVVDANTTGVTDMSRMFSGCSNLTSVSLFDTANVTTMRRMLFRCSSLTSLPTLNTANVTDMNAMLYGCSSLTSLPTLNTANVTNMGNMLYGCSSLTSLPTLNTASVTEMGAAFYNCTAVESGALALYQQASSQATPPTDHSGCFTNCGSNAPADAPIHAEMLQIPASWGGLGA